MLQSPYLPTPFSLTNQPLVAPFWGDVDTRSSGEVFYRLTTNQALLAEVGMEIRRSFVNSRGFFPTSLFIATWNDVGYYENHADLVGVSFVLLLLLRDGFHTKQQHFPLSSAPAHHFSFYRFEVSRGSSNHSLKNYSFLCDAIFFFTCMHAHKSLSLKM